LKGQPEDIPWNTERIAGLIEELGAIGADPQGGVSRQAFSEEDLEARERIQQIMRNELGLRVRIDPWGNIIGRREGFLKDAPVIMTGSHLDTVRNGGKFDGAAGVVGAAELVRALNEMGIRTRHPLEMVVFAAEEPNDFGISTMGSRGMAGKLKRQDLEGRTNPKGEELLWALERAGGDPQRLHEGVRLPGEILAFIEIHIEQMPYLERAGKDIGVVKGVTGIRRLRLTVQGEAGHGGTTPMDQRRDALVAAASLIGKIDALARRERGRAVATVGHLSVYPNRVNIIPSEAALELELRSFHLPSLQRMERGLETAISDAEAKRSVRISKEETYRTEPAMFSPAVRKSLLRACRRCGFSSMELVSMAGHDAYHLSAITEAGMIFVPSRSGASHCPQEWTSPQQILKGIRVLFEALLHLDQRLEVMK
jgi:N-carbamoyl-L-amino-acid hydrolase